MISISSSDCKYAVKLTDWLTAWPPIVHLLEYYIRETIVVFGLVNLVEGSTFGMASLLRTTLTNFILMISDFFLNHHTLTQNENKSFIVVSQRFLKCDDVFYHEIWWNENDIYTDMVSVISKYILWLNNDDFWVK